jgi:hypothetical protein
VRTCPHEPVRCVAQTVAITDAMRESEFMAYVLAQLLTGQRHPLAKLTDDDREAMDEEPIGEHFLQYPFLY